MHVELKFITPNAVEFIGQLAGICYGSKNEPAANIRRALHCKDSGHLATLRFATATFHVSGISRVCSHQFVRSKHLDFLQRSQRYCSEKNSSFITPTLTDEQHKAYYTAVLQSQMAYDELISLGVKKEDARFVLPEATTTELIVTGNFQAWLDFIALRADTHAQLEIRQVAKTINNLLAKELDNKLFNWMPI
jgi:thymidylate synthase (FAD)